MSRRIRWIGGIAGLGAAVAVVIAWPIFRPSESLPESADAVVVFAGGQGERLDRALELMDAQVAPTLVLNTGSDRWNADAYDAQIAVCNDTTLPFEVVCVAAVPDSTKGEAKTFADMAGARGWASLVAVTDDYHLRRASRWLDRCFDGTVFRAIAVGDQGLAIRLREFAATGAMLTIDRSCG